MGSDKPFSIRLNRRREKILGSMAEVVGLPRGRVIQGFLDIYDQDRTFRWWINLVLRSYRPGEFQAKYSTWEDYDKENRDQDNNEDDQDPGNDP